MRGGGRRREHDEERRGGGWRLNPPREKRVTVEDEYFHHCGISKFDAKIRLMQISVDPYLYIAKKRIRP